MPTPSRRKPDIVRLLEVAYAGAPSDEAWLTRVLESAAPSLDRGLGVIGLIYQDVATPRCVVPVGIRSQHDVDSYLASRSVVPPDVLTRMMLRGPTYDSGSSASGLSRRQYDSLFQKAYDPAQGFRDTLGICTGYPGEPGCLIMALSPTVSSPKRADAALWTRVATHLASGLRLRDRAPRREPEAVLSPSGKVEHAEGAATPASVRVALTDAAMSMDRARGPLRHRDPEGAVEIWQGLVCGMWSLVDHFDHDGRRHLVARRNTPTVADATALDARQRQICALAALGHSNKFIGYELGVPASTVSWHLGRAAKKLGVSSRTELRAAMARPDAVGQPGGAPGDSVARSG